MASIKTNLFTSSCVLSDVGSHVRHSDIVTFQLFLKDSYLFELFFAVPCHFSFSVSFQLAIMIRRRPRQAQIDREDIPRDSALRNISSVVYFVSLEPGALIGLQYNRQDVSLKTSQNHQLDILAHKDVIYLQQVLKEQGQANEYRVCSADQS
jgi:hypothetical protein